MPRCWVGSIPFWPVFFYLSLTSARVPCGYPTAYMWDGILVWASFWDSRYRVWTWPLYGRPESQAATPSWAAVTVLRAGCLRHSSLPRPHSLYSGECTVGAVGAAQRRPRPATTAAKTPQRTGSTDP